MKQVIVGPRKTIFFLLIISMLVFQTNFARADEWKDAGFSEDEALGWKNAGFSKDEALGWVWVKDGGVDEAMRWKDAGFSFEVRENGLSPYIELSEASQWRKAGFDDASEAKFWKLVGYDARAAAQVKLFLPTPNEYKQFKAKYCKNGLLAREAVPPNYNDDDGTRCYLFRGEVFQVLGDNKALYSMNGDARLLYYIQFGKGGRATSSILALVTVKGGHEYQSLAGIRIVPELRILKMASGK